MCCKHGRSVAMGGLCCTSWVNVWNFKSSHHFLIEWKFDLMPSRDPLRVHCRKKAFLAEFLVATSFLSEWRYAASFLRRSSLLNSDNRLKTFWLTCNLWTTRAITLLSSVQSKYHLGEPVTKWEKMLYSYLLRWGDYRPCLKLPLKQRSSKYLNLNWSKKFTTIKFRISNLQ